MTQQKPELKIICEDDCGNAPKKAQLRDFNIAFARANTEEVLDYLTEDVIWNMVGEKTLKGKQEVAEFLKQMEDSPASELKIDYLITHGTDCAATGQLTFPGGEVVDFCDVYIFAGHAKDTKIKWIKSYAVDLKPASE